MNITLYALRSESDPKSLEIGGGGLRQDHDLSSLGRKESSSLDDSDSMTCTPLTCSEMPMLRSDDGAEAWTSLPAMSLKRATLRAARHASSMSFNFLLRGLPPPMYNNSVL
jgi:hypothetical protein